MSEYSMVYCSIRILHSGPEAQNDGDSRNHGLWDPCACVVFRAPIFLCPKATSEISPQTGLGRSCFFEVLDRTLAKELRDTQKDRLLCVQNAVCA